MILTFINHIGKLYDGNDVYEFYFNNTDQLEEVLLEDLNWSHKPAMNNPKAPSKVEKVFYMKTDKKLDLLKNNGTFRYMDGVQGTVAIMWSKEKIYNSTLNIFFGLTLEQVQTELFKFNLSLKEKML